MPVIVDQLSEYRVPVWVHDFNSFVKWMHSEEFPDEGRIHFLNGEVWIDLSMEELYTHNFIKSAVTITLGRLVQKKNLGIYICDGMRFTNAEAEIATVPDAMYVSHKSWEVGNVHTRSGAKGKATELRGTPDLVVEILSPSSEEKDTDWMLSAYANANIPEYWLVDARDTPIQFEAYKLGPKGYIPIRKVAGWLRSPVLGHSFRWVTSKSSRAIPTYSLRLR